MIGKVVAGLGLPVLVRAVRRALGKLDHPVAEGAAAAMGDVEELLAMGAISDDRIAEANRHIEAMAELESADLREAIREVNLSLRAEIASSDPYVRRMRPTFGYIIAVTWAGQMGAIAWTILDDPAAAGPVINAMAALSTIWTVGLSVLGIYVYKRSQEKTAGLDPAASSGVETGWLTRLAGKRERDRDS